MALGTETIFTRCPECGSKDVRESVRVEAGEMDNDEDFAVYICGDDTCLLVFDYITHPKESNK